MGGSSSKSNDDHAYCTNSNMSTGFGYGDYYQRPRNLSYSRHYDDQQYRTGIINDRSINQVLRENAYRLSGADQALLRQAQHLATAELDRTMKDCELCVYLDGFNVTLRSGRCSNKIILQRNYNGEIVWRFVRRDFTQRMWDVGRSVRSFLGRVGSFLARAVPSVLSFAAPLALGW